MQFNMGLKIVCFVVVAIAVLSIQESEAAPELGLIKAKLALKKVPHVIAKVAVAKEVKTKAKVAAVASLAAIKAKAAAAWSIIHAPFLVAKKTIALKAAGLKAVGLKAAKALKVAKVVKGAKVAKHLKKLPLILPIKKLI